METIRCPILPIFVRSKGSSTVARDSGEIVDRFQKRSRNSPPVGKLMTVLKIGQQFPHFSSGAPILGIDPKIVISVFEIWRQTYFKYVVSYIKTTILKNMQFLMSSNFQINYSIELVLIWGWKKWYGLSKLGHWNCFNNTLKYEIFVESALFSHNFVGSCGPILTNHAIFSTSNQD